ncbi:hypothetical protein [Streptomyces sp. NPDC050738]|uniref:hypothetical protein n=1 Tax=Streptomyces sp. NPDC050738 TaxID=3154744 RepID=UPI00343AF592
MSTQLMDEYEDVYFSDPTGAVNKTKAKAELFYDTDCWGKPEATVKPGDSFVGEYRAVRFAR